MANKLYVNPETATLWDDSASNEDINTNALGSDDVSNCGSYIDLGSAARSEWYRWELFIDGFGTGTLAVGESVDLYFSTAQEGVNTDDFDGPPTGTPSTSAGYALDGTSAAERRQKLLNLVPAGSVIAHTATTSEDFKASGRVKLPGRYVSPVVHNNTGAALASVDTHVITLSPIPPELQ